VALLKGQVDRVVTRRDLAKPFKNGQIIKLLNVATRRGSVKGVISKSEAILSESSPRTTVHIILMVSTKHFTGSHGMLMSGENSPE
jgi:hypothetical protein